jgi:hypothetical protein
VASEVAAALLLAMSKGYIEKEDLNRPRNSRFAQPTKLLSTCIRDFIGSTPDAIDDKTLGEDDK